MEKTEFFEGYKSEPEYRPMTMKTEEGNKLIAEFMDCISIQNRRNDTVYKNTPVIPHAHYELKFHSSWDWLMPVAEKIEKLANSEFEDYYIAVNLYLSHGHAEIILDDFDDPISFRGENDDFSMIMNAWKAICEFITWYNENKDI